jgi:hypothetical protein
MSPSAKVLLVDEMAFASERGRSGVAAVASSHLGPLFLVEIDARGPQRLEAVPLKLEHCRTRLARGEDAEWIRRRFIAACAELRTKAVADDGRVVVARSRARGQDPVARVDRVDDPD